MSAGVNDFHPLLRAAIAEARAAGFGEAAAVLESKVLAAGTTSSELLGTVGAAIVEFLAGRRARHCRRTWRTNWDGASARSARFGRNCEHAATAA